MLSQNFSNHSNYFAPFTTVTIITKLVPFKSINLVLFDSGFLLISKLFRFPTAFCTLEILNHQLVFLAFISHDMASHLTTPFKITEWNRLRNQTDFASALREQALLKGSRMLCGLLAQCQADQVGEWAK